MPYPGIDSKKDTKWMEDCVNKVMKNSHKEKSVAIAICTSVLEKSKANLGLATFILNDIYGKEDYEPS